MAVVWPSKNNFVDGDVLTATNMNNIGDTLNVFNPTSATNGQVWVANGSGSGSYSTPSGGMTLIQSINLTSGTRHTISSIPTSYQSLYIRAANVTATGGPGGLGIELNGITSNYRVASRVGTSQPAVTPDAYVTTYLVSSYANYLLGFGTVTSTVGLQFWGIIENSGQASTKYKTIYSQATGTENGYWTVREALGFCTDATTDAAITSIALYGNGVTFTGGTFQVYGVK